MIKSLVYAPGPVLLLGAPGVGKGTQAKLLMADFAVPQVSTGDLLREHRRGHTALGLAAEDLMKRGELVPDTLVNQMVAERLSAADCARGYILDGFPRTLIQARWLDTFLTEGDSQPPVVAISLEVAHDVLLHRVTGRRVCAQGHIYNIYSKAPRVPDRCDVDGERLEQRTDDTEAVFEQRMKTFHDLTAPVIEHYRELGRFSAVDGAGAVEDVASAIRSELQHLRGASLTQRSI